MGFFDDMEKEKRKQFAKKDAMEKMNQQLRNIYEVETNFGPTVENFITLYNQAHPYDKAKVAISYEGIDSQDYNNKTEYHMLIHIRHNVTEMRYDLICNVYIYASRVIYVKYMASIQGLFGKEDKWVCKKTTSKELQEKSQLAEQLIEMAYKRIS